MKTYFILNGDAPVFYVTQFIVSLKFLQTERFRHLRHGASPRSKYKSAKRLVWTKKKRWYHTVLSFRKCGASVLKNAIHELSKFADYR